MSPHEWDIILDRVDRFLEALNRVAAAIERTNKLKEEERVAIEALKQKIEKL